MTCDAESGFRFTGKQLAGFIGGAVVLAVAVLMPETTVSHGAIMSLGVLLACVFMWFCGSMSTGVVGLVGCFLLFVFNVQPTFGDAFSGFTQPTTWFVLGVYCMTALMQHSTLGIRLTRRFVIWARADSRKLVLAVMLATALCSSIMTDTGAVALSMSFALPLLNAVGVRKGESNLGKCLLMGIAIGSCIGGFTTPCGHSLNVLSIGLVESLTGESIGFLSWMAYGVPCAVAMLPIAWLSLVRAFPPEAIAESDVQALLDGSFRVGKFSTTDKKCLVIMLLLLTLWVLGNWITWLDPTMVALLGMFLLFVPGINIVSWKDFEGLASWNLFLFFGGILSIGAAIKGTGMADCIAAAFLDSGIMDFPALAALILIAAFLYLLQTFCPIAPAWCTIFLPPLVMYAQAIGLSVACPTFLIVALMAGSYLVPLCPAMNMTYDAGYYRFGELAKGGWLPSIALVLTIPLWSYALGVLMVV